MFENDEFEQEEWEPQKVCEWHHSDEGIEAVRFSPDGRLLAAANRDNFIDIYDVADNFRRVGKCSGHSSAVLQIDWSADGKVREILILTSSSPHPHLILTSSCRAGLDEQLHGP